jgi:hypothetical protein
MKTTSIALVLTVTVTAGSIGFATGCRKQGPAESAGEKIDRAAEKAKDAVDPPGPAEKAGRKVDRAIGTD